MIRSTDVFTVKCPNAKCQQSCERSAWWLLTQSEAYCPCPVCATDMSASIANLVHELGETGYAGARERYKAVEAMSTHRSRYDSLAFR